MLARGVRKFYTCALYGVVKYCAIYMFGGYLS